MYGDIKPDKDKTIARIEKALGLTKFWKKKGKEEVKPIKREVRVAFIYDHSVDSPASNVRQCIFDLRIAGAIERTEYNELSEFAQKGYLHTFVVGLYLLSEHLPEEVWKKRAYCLLAIAGALTEGVTIRKFKGQGWSEFTVKALKVLCENFEENEDPALAYTLCKKILKEKSEAAKKDAGAYNCVNAALRSCLKVAEIRKDLERMEFFSMTLGKLKIEWGNYEDARNYFAISVAFIRKVAEGIGNVKVDRIWKMNFRHCCDGLRLLLEHREEEAAWEQVEEMFDTCCLMMESYEEINKKPAPLDTGGRQLLLTVTNMIFTKARKDEKGQPGLAASRYELVGKALFEIGRVDGDLEKLRNSVNCNYKAALLALKREETIPRITKLRRVDVCYQVFAVSCLTKAVIASNLLRRVFHDKYALTMRQINSYSLFLLDEAQRESKCGNDYQYIADKMERLNDKNEQYFLDALEVDSEQMKIADTKEITKDAIVAALEAFLKGKEYC